MRNRRAPLADKTIAISTANYEQLRLLGHTPDTFDDIMTKLLKSNSNTISASEKKRKKA